VQGLSVALFAAAGGLLCGLVRARIGLVPALLVGLLLLFPRIENAALSGLESALVLLVFVLLIVEALRSGALWRREPRAADARTGALVGLFLLARLDSVFVGTRSPSMSCTARRRGRLARGWRGRCARSPRLWPTVRSFLPLSNSSRSVT
jgi:hypothetical protein